jgi:hypothetical protein
MGELIGYARCSTVLQDLTAQRQALTALGVPDDRIYLDKGLTGTSRARPGLDQALAAVRSGDTLVVPKLDRLARSVPDARHLDLKGYGALMINRHPDRLRNRQVTGCLRDGLLAANPDGCRGAPYFFTTDALPAA